MLVKMHTGLKDVSAAAYLQQADEVCEKLVAGSDGLTHPEMFIRARALRLWRDSPDSADDGLEAMVEGPLALKELDLLRQRKVSDLTRRFLQQFLTPLWLQTTLVAGHARRFFEDFTFAGPVADQGDSDVPGETSRKSSGQRDSGKTQGESGAQRSDLKSLLKRCDGQLRNYFCYLLLDFVTCDANLEEAPLAAAFLFAEENSLIEEFRDLAATELKLGKRLLQKIEAEAKAIVKSAEKELTR
ncbi:MAG: hypothetical protein R3C19_19955 [Planctomycetaceae bacterium]